MKRRKALQSLAAVTAVIAWAPSCSVLPPVPTFTNLPLTPEEYGLIKAIAEAILPNSDKTNNQNAEAKPVVDTPEPVQDFVLTMVNDCMGPLEIKRYLRGLRTLHQHVQDEHEQRFEQLNKYQHVLLFSELIESPGYPESISFFLKTTKQLAVRQFTSSEYFLKEKLDWEFIPGRYIGAVPA